MDLSTLCLAYSILEEHGIRKPAALAGRPPSSASAALQRVEAVISVPLARRDGRRLIPTLEAEARMPRLASIAQDARALAALATGEARAIPAVPLATLARYAAAARTGSIRQAARTLRLGQPQLTRQLSALEAALGCRLFDRSPDGVACTAKGLEALALAEQIGEAWESLRAASAERFRKTAATWRLGSVIPFGHESEIAGMLARLAVGWQTARPRQPLFLSSTTADELISGLKSRRFDLVLLDVASYPAEFEGALVARSRLALAAPRSLPEAQRQDPASLLKSRPVAVPSARSGLRQMTERFLAECLSPVERARLTLVEVDSIPVIINLVLNHDFVSVLPELSVANIAAPPALISLPEGYTQSLSLVWPKNPLSRQAAKTVLDLLGNTAKKHHEPAANR